jgi:hypothetical protein
MELPASVRWPTKNPFRLSGFDAEACRAMKLRNKTTPEPRRAARNLLLGVAAGT